MLACEIERLDPVAGSDGLITVRLQQVMEELHVELIVLHDQDSLGHFGPPATPPGDLLVRAKRPPRPRRANGQNLSKTLVAIRYGKANTDGERHPYHPENRRKPRDSGARLSRRRPRGPR